MTVELSTDTLTEEGGADGAVSVRGSEWKRQRSLLGGLTSGHRGG